MNDNHDEQGRFAEASATAYKATKNARDVHADEKSTSAQKIDANQKAAEAHDKAAVTAQRAGQDEAVKAHEESATAHRAAANEVQSSEAKIAVMRAESEAKISEMHGNEDQGEIKGQTYDHQKEIDKAKTQFEEAIQKAKSELQPGEKIYARYSKGPKYDMKEGAISIDHQTGEKHAGLSAVKIYGDDSTAAQAKQATEYLSIQGAGSSTKLNLYAGKEVGRDSDNGPVIQPTRHIGTFSQKTADHLSVHGKEGVIKEGIKEDEERISGLKDESAIRITKKDIEKQKASLAQAKRENSEFLERRYGTQPER